VTDTTTETQFLTIPDGGDEQQPLESHLLTIADTNAASADQLIALTDQTRNALFQLYTAFERGEVDREVMQITLSNADGVFQALQTAVNNGVALAHGMGEMITTLQEQRNAVLEKYQELEESIPEVERDAYHAGLHHIEECPDCQAAMMESLWEDSDEIYMDQISHAVLHLRQLGRDDEANELETKAAQAIELREETEARITAVDQIVAVARRDGQYAVPVDMDDELDLDDLEGDEYDSDDEDDVDA
jgi:hypothetical protein